MEFWNSIIIFSAGILEKEGKQCDYTSLPLTASSSRNLLFLILRR